MGECKMNYRMATSADIELLVLQRLNFIGATENHRDYDLIKENCRLYFNKAMDNQTCDVILAEENGACLGTGIIFYYDSVPSAFNVTGKNAYITSIYVEPTDRRRGIGTEIVNRLVEQAGSRGYSIIMLNATETGKSIYKKLGFEEISNGMILNRNKRI